jgi:hypothetical protein
MYPRVLPRLRNLVYYDLSVNASHSIFQLADEEKDRIQEMKRS